MISVIIPIYNREKILKKILDSILNQTHKPAEVIAVNDGSLDKSGKVAENYKKIFLESRIEYIVLHKKNNGAPSARNLGFEKSKGNYLFFCDADAILHPEALKIMLKTLNDNPEASYAYPSFYWGRKFFRVGNFSAKKLKNGPFIHTMALIRREHFPQNKWDESIKKLQDWDLWLTMLGDGHIGIWINKALFKIQTGGTISNWLPSFAYKLMPWLKGVKKYKEAIEIIKKKHGL